VSPFWKTQSPITLIDAALRIEIMQMALIMRLVNHVLETEALLEVVSLTQ